MRVTPEIPVHAEHRLWTPPLKLRPLSQRERRGNDGHHGKDGKNRRQQQDEVPGLIGAGDKKQAKYRGHRAHVSHEVAAPEDPGALVVVLGELRPQDWWGTFNKVMTA